MFVWKDENKQKEAEEKPILKRGDRKIQQIKKVKIRPVANPLFKINEYVIKLSTYYNLASDLQF